jgi:hypothetical protein
LTLCIIISGLVAFFLTKTLKYGIAVLGASSGAALGFLVSNTFQIHHASVYWIVVATLALTFGFASFKARDQLMIISTSIIGSYLFWRGISLYTGGFPNEFELTNKFESGAWDKLPWTFYLYLGLMSVTMAGGFLYQRMKYRQDHPYYKHPYHGL